jgi:hypothetical protein
VVVSPRASHALGILVVWYNVVGISELFVADYSFPILLDNLAFAEDPATIILSKSRTRMKT